MTKKKILDDAFRTLMDFIKANVGDIFPHHIYICVCVRDLNILSFLQLFYNLTTGNQDNRIVVDRHCNHIAYDTITFIILI